jgi:hypothetical protein
MTRDAIYIGPRATVDQMTEARALCGKDEALIAKLDSLLKKQPNDRIMGKFIDYLRDPKRHDPSRGLESQAFASSKAVSTPETYETAKNG